MSFQNTVLAEMQRFMHLEFENASLMKFRTIAMIGCKLTYRNVLFQKLL